MTPIRKSFTLLVMTIALTTAADVPEVRPPGSGTARNLTAEEQEELALLAELSRIKDAADQAHSVNNARDFADEHDSLCWIKRKLAWRETTPQLQMTMVQRLINYLLPKYNSLVAKSEVEKSLMFKCDCEYARTTLVASLPRTSTVTLTDVSSAPPSALLRLTENPEQATYASRIESVITAARRGDGADHPDWTRYFTITERPIDGQRIITFTLDPAAVQTSIAAVSPEKREQLDLSLNGVLKEFEAHQRNAGRVDRVGNHFDGYPAALPPKKPGEKEDM